MRATLTRSENRNCNLAAIRISISSSSRAIRLTLLCPQCECVVPYETHAGTPLYTLGYKLAHLPERQAVYTNGLYERDRRSTNASSSHQIFSEITETRCGLSVHLFAGANGYVSVDMVMNMNLDGNGSEVWMANGHCTEGWLEGWDRYWYWCCARFCQIHVFWKEQSAILLTIEI